MYKKIASITISMFTVTYLTFSGNENPIDNQQAIQLLTTTHEVAVSPILSAAPAIASYPQATIKTQAPVLMEAHDKYNNISDEERIAITYAEQSNVERARNESLQDLTMVIVYSSYMFFEEKWEFDFEYVAATIRDLDSNQMPSVAMPYYCWDSNGKFHHEGKTLQLGQYSYTCRNIGNEGNAPLHYWEMFI
ncbi:MAG: hypothetical protein OEZ43_10920 [Gammaproteobacteria bacterium]|nr:hypothetical protein [Gammaproteobacteria bacterium]